MKFSLILCTLERTNIICDLFDSLLTQNYKNFEVIVVDQNTDDRLDKILEIYSQNISIIHIKSVVGLSIARNAGLTYATGEIICFPDDDCTYPPDLLQNVVKFFIENSNMDILLGKTVESSSFIIVAGKPLYKRMLIKCSHFGGSSTTLFINTKLKEKKYFLFDEHFGLGAIFQSEEENDLIIRLLKRGMIGKYEPETVYVYHPRSDLDYSDLQRARNRGYGFGAFIAKHIFTVCGLVYFFKYLFFRVPISILYGIIFLDIKKTIYTTTKYIWMWRGLISFFVFKFKN